MIMEPSTTGIKKNMVSLKSNFHSGHFKLHYLSIEEWSNRSQGCLFPIKCLTRIKVTQNRTDCSEGNRTGFLSPWLFSNGEEIFQIFFKHC